MAKTYKVFKRDATASRLRKIQNDLAKGHMPTVTLALDINSQKVICVGSNHEAAVKKLEHDKVPEGTWELFSFEVNY